MPLYIGLMSGTSMDAVDAALVALEPRDAPIRVLATHSHPIPLRLQHELAALCLPGADEIRRLATADGDMGRLFAKAARALLEQSGTPPGEVHGIGSHGQTVRHYPGEAIAQSLQIGDPNLIAEATGITTVADFRRRDMAAGGQGAPLVPAFHSALFRKTGNDRVVINIGGIANITVLPGDPTLPVTGFDTGPGNTLLDLWVRRHLGLPMDTDGRFAASGTPHPGLLARLAADAYFSRPPPKSTGREHFNLAWLEGQIAGLGGSITPADVQATLVQLTGDSIGRAISRWAGPVRQIYVCGGGTSNPLLMQDLRRRFPETPVESTQTLGLAPEWVEAAAFAWLARETLHGHNGNLPEVTGARHPVVLGGIYPGASGAYTTGL